MIREPILENYIMFMMDWKFLHDLYIRHRASARERV